MGAIKPLFFKDGEVILLDQSSLPKREEYITCSSYSEIRFAIQNMVTRGAPLIGAVAAYGAVLACEEYLDSSKQEFQTKMDKAFTELEDSRPTAVNLFWALDRMKTIIQKYLPEVDELDQLYQLMLNEAHEICQEDLIINYSMAKKGASLVKNNANILTHCNTGALATTGYGTALGVIRESHNLDKNVFVYVDETRPRLQGAKLTAWELQQEKIPCKLICDSTSGMLMQQGEVDLVLVGADRIATNGDVANKIGTYMLSVLAKEHRVPLYVVAPISTIDFNTDNGQDISIEERNFEEITKIEGVPIVPDEINVYNPAFDVTPAENISGIITEKGIAAPKRDEIMKLKS